MNNRIADPNFEYDDGRGNLTEIPTGEKYVYDAENRQVVYCDSSILTLQACADGMAAPGKTFYYYDGEGRRVSKMSGSEMEIYVYDARGRLAAEYGGTSEVTGTHYVTADHLGSTRVITDSSKAVIQCRDYLPFGGELLASAQNERNGIPCYSADTGLRQKFTGYERDSESRLDFAQARYYSWAGGRFQSPDEPLLDQWADDPQSWNLYAYARNNPVLFSDSTGQECEIKKDEDGNEEPGPCHEEITVHGDPIDVGYLRFALESAGRQSVQQLADASRAALDWAMQPRDTGCLHTNSLLSSSL